MHLRKKAIKQSIERKKALKVERRKARNKQRNDTIREQRIMATMQESIKG